MKRGILREYKDIKKSVGKRLVFSMQCFFILEGCKKELPQTGVSKPGQAKVEKGHRELGLGLYEKGKNAEAIAEFKKAIADNTANVEVYYKLASACYDEEMTNDAINMYKKLLRQNQTMSRRAMISRLFTWRKDCVKTG